MADNENSITTLNRTNQSTNNAIWNRNFSNEFEMSIFNDLIEMTKIEGFPAFINNFLSFNNKYFAKFTF